MSSVQVTSVKVVKDNILFSFSFTCSRFVSKQRSSMVSIPGEVGVLSNNSVSRVSCESDE